ncbi:MAG TPA: UbiX family flavin prenyltransferase [Chloroflexota bacterium]|jgi:4-hydroxy-3-polyprenylbenzoate decarboxylase|nr:UbiX family flavin prenyltransferase [Chloroflexota bacterium]
MRIVVGISGSSGAVYGVRLLEVLSETAGVETELVITPAAETNIGYETSRSVDDVRSLATRCYSSQNLAAAISSGSYRTDGMVVAPCSANSLAGIAYGANSNNLLLRAADVTLKERRRLILLFRETPLHRGHIKAMLEATENGAIVMPPVPSFYHQPASVADLVDHTIARVLDLLGIEHALSKRWGGLS